MAVRIEDGGAGTVRVDNTSRAASVELYDSNGNRISVVDGTTIPAAGQGVVPIGIVARETVRAVRGGRYGGISVEQRRILLNEQCEGATINTQRWTSTATTMTAAQTAAGLTFNASAITTTTTGILYTSRQQFMRASEAPLMFYARARFTTVANQVWELGFGHSGTLSGTTAQVENGAHWRHNAAGAVVPVLIYNSTEVTGSDISGSLASTNFYDWIVIVDDDRATFIVSNSATGAVISEQVLRVPLTQPRYYNVTHQYAWIRLRNNSAPASAGQLIVGEVAVYQLDVQDGTPLHQQLAGNTQTAVLNPTAITQSAQFANSAAPASATLSNTAAGYTTLGGLYQWANLAGAATDYCLFGYAVPAPYRLKIFGVRISMINTGAANAATPATTCYWGLGINGASANLATGAHIRTALGHTSIPISAAIGAASDTLAVWFEVPIVCEPGTTLAVIMRVVAGAATASQVIAGTVAFDAVFE